jgi:hypothetical protein
MAVGDANVFYGMRGTGSWTTDERPKNFREQILYQEPNGQAPLTAMLSKMRREKTNDPEFNWWTDELQNQRAVITDVYTDSGLSAAYASGGVAGDVLYLKIDGSANSDFVRQFRVGHTIVIRTLTDVSKDRFAKVTLVTEAGASSYLRVTLRQTDTGNALANATAGALIALLIATSNEEGADRPAPVTWDLTKYSNYTWIHRTPLEISRTAMQTTLRTGEAYTRLRKNALKQHSIGLEKGFLFSYKTEVTGAGGLPERTTMGIIPMINTHVPGNMRNYITDDNAQWNGANWLDGGESWWDATMLDVWRFQQSSELLCFCGDKFLSGLERLAKFKGLPNFTVGQTVTWGIRLDRMRSTGGDIMVKMHPLFCQEESLRSAALIFDPKNLVERYIQDTMFKPDTLWKEGGSTGTDGKKEEFLTETGLEYHFPNTFMFLQGVGEANTNAAA